VASKNLGVAVCQCTCSETRPHGSEPSQLERVSRCRQLGVSLVEVMIAMLIVSVGVLGVTGMQLVSLRHNQSAMLLTEALMLGNDIIDRMQANPAIDYSPVVLESAPPSALNCTITLCSPTQMADYDIALWMCSINSAQDSAMNTPHQVCVDLDVSGSLPEGVGSISKAGAVYLITVQWLDDRAGARRDILLHAQMPGL
jgi:type IV pilus assembly protein PilV